MHIEVWIKAFIPSHLYSLSGQELTWRSKCLTFASDNKTAYFLPLLTYFPYLLASYATDQRYFSSDIDASARITTVIKIPNQDGDVKFHRYSNPTFRVSGKMMDVVTGNNSRIDSKISKPRGKEVIERIDNILHITFTSSGCNPFFQSLGFSYAPSITMEFDLDLDFKTDELEVNLSGKVSQFPAFEAYIKINDNKPICLFQHLPRLGNTGFNLLCGEDNIEAHASINTTINSTAPSFS